MLRGGRNRRDRGRVGRGVRHRQAGGRVWYSTLALLVARARKAFVDGGWGRRVERLTGAVLIGLGIRLALERR
jgi:hypothetical protein